MNHDQKGCLGCLGLLILTILTGILIGFIPELFIFIWISVPILTPFFISVSNQRGNNFYTWTVVLNFLFYFWGLGDMVKESFGKKYIKGFQSYSYDEEYGRYDTSHTTYEFYIPDIFWNNIYDWFGTFFFIYSISFLILVQFFHGEKIKKDEKEKMKKI